MKCKTLWLFVIGNLVLSAVCLFEIKKANRSLDSMNAKISNENGKEFDWGKAAREAVKRNEYLRKEHPISDPQEAFPNSLKDNVMKRDAISKDSLISDWYLNQSISADILSQKFDVEFGVINKLRKPEDVLADQRKSIELIRSKISPFDEVANEDLEKWYAFQLKAAKDLRRYIAEVDVLDVEVDGYLLVLDVQDRDWKTIRSEKNIPNEK